MGLGDDFLRLLGYSPFFYPGRRTRRVSTSALTRYGLDRPHGLGSRDDRLGSVLASASTNPPDISGIALATQLEIKNAQQTQAHPVPKSRTFTFSFSVSANRRKTFSIGPLIGNVVISEFYWVTAAGTTPPAGAIDLGTAFGAIFENDVLVATGVGWVSLIERLNPYNYGTITPSTFGGFPLATIPSSANRNLQYPINRVIQLPSFFLVVSVTNNSGAIAELDGHITLLEQISDEQLANFVLSG